MATPAEKYAKALADAADNATRLETKRLAELQRALDAAADELSKAIERHDAAVEKAEQARDQAARAEAGRTAGIVAQAVADFDAAMAEAVGAPAGCQVVTTPAGSLELHDPRERRPVATCSPAHGGHWRCMLPSGVVFLPEEYLARAALWESLRAAVPA